MLRALARILACAAVFLGGCNLVPSRDPTGEMLPSAEGKTLDGAPVTLRGELDGKPAILMIPYTDDAQFDCDRWSLGLDQLHTPMRRFELGVVPSTFGVVAAPAIDMSRRQKRAEVAWPTVLCFYGDGADALATQTGMGDAQYARVMLVDAAGAIRWYCDKGYTAERCEELDRAARALGQ
ncbi:MAG: hypothetical protein U0572_15290 [Phycisphaerales bacterium]